MNHGTNGRAPAGSAGRVPPTAAGRGSALFTVLAVVAIASMLGAIVMTAGDSTATATDRQVERIELRATAWSGVQAAMAELAAQRQDLLDGKAPVLTPETPLAEEGSERPVARLMAWEPEAAASRAGAAEKVYAVAEGAKLDLNRADAAMLAALGLPEATAGEIAARRGARPFTSVEELATLGSATVAEVFGPGAPAPTERPAGPEAAGLPAYAELFTTLSFDPNVQAGLASGESAGKLRINIGQGWSDEVGRVLTEELGQAASDAVKKLVEQTKVLDTDTALAAALQQQGVPKELTGAALDVLTVSDDLFVPGRVDVMRARAEVLAAIPGIGKDKAAAIVAARGQLTEEERKGRAWPYTRGILTPEEFAKALPWMTSRSLQWRVRVQASVERAASGAAPGEAKVLRSAAYEAVIDVSSERPRLAYWREITLMPIARAMEKRVSGLARSLAESRAPAAPEPEAPAEPPPPEAPPPDGPPPAADNPPPPPAPPASGESGAMKDRRTGRWKGGT